MPNELSLIPYSEINIFEQLTVNNGHSVNRPDGKKYMIETSSYSVKHLGKVKKLALANFFR